MFRIWSYSAFTLISRITNYSKSCSLCINLSQTCAPPVSRLLSNDHNLFQVCVCVCFSTHLRFCNRFWFSLKERQSNQYLLQKKHKKRFPENEWFAINFIFLYITTTKNGCTDPSPQPTNQTIKQTFVRHWKCSGLLTDKMCLKFALCSPSLKKNSSIQELTLTADPLRECAWDWSLLFLHFSRLNLHFCWILLLFSPHILNRHFFWLVKSTDFFFNIVSLLYILAFFWKYPLCGH